MSYRTYDPLIKKLIIESGNPNLFPDLNIPRTTINYWIKQSKSKSTTERNEFYDKAIKSQNDELLKLKTTNFLLKKVLGQFYHDVTCYSPVSKKNREFLVGIIEEFRELLPLKDILEVLSISHNQYYRWEVEVKGCELKSRKCYISRPNQLSQDEVKLLIYYATSEKYKVFSTTSLMYYCRRKGLLNCSLDSWYKYMRLYGVTRKKESKAKKYWHQGIRASRSNEYWHIDITEIKYAKGSKAYLQVIVDNYSRMIIGWTLADNKKANVTIKTLTDSLKKVPSFQGKLISDGGGENIASSPRGIMFSRGIKHYIAKKDIKFSNSMVEAVFRTFKQRYYLERAKTYQTLQRKVYRFVNHYNEITPHYSLKGLTPIERFCGDVSVLSIKNEFKESNKRSIESRAIKYNSCKQCLDQVS